MRKRVLTLALAIISILGALGFEPIPALAYEDFQAELMSQDQVYIDGNYLFRIGKTAGEIKRIIGQYESEFTHNSRYYVKGVGSDIYYMFLDEDYSWEKKDSDTCFRIEAPLGKLVPNMHTTMYIDEFTESLSKWYSNVQFEVMYGAGTAYYVSDCYARVTFSGVNFSAYLDIPLEDEHRIYTTMYAWLYISSGSYSETVEPTPPANSPTATPTTSAVYVNGFPISFDAYNINGNNYFKLRDIAYTLSGTTKQFELAWDGVNNAIILKSGQRYTAVGGEMKGKGEGAKSPIPTTSKIYLDGAEVSFTAYNIDGNNYFKLRDIGEAFDFGLDWDGTNNRIILDTSKGYQAD